MDNSKLKHLLAPPNKWSVGYMKAVHKLVDTYGTKPITRKELSDELGGSHRFSNGMLISLEGNIMRINAEYRIRIIWDEKAGERDEDLIELVDK